MRKSISFFNPSKAGLFEGRDLKDFIINKQQTMECYFCQFCYSNSAEEISESSLLEPNYLRLFQKTPLTLLILRY